MFYWKRKPRWPSAGEKQLIYPATVSRWLCKNESYVIIYTSRSKFVWLSITENDDKSLNVLGWFVHPSKKKNSLKSV